MHQPTHPGAILYINDGDGSQHKRPLDEIPEDKHFVYLLKGVETHDPAQADEVIPIVEVRLTPIGGNGGIVPDSLANEIIVSEFGPNQRLLRSTTMARD